MWTMDRATGSEPKEKARLFPARIVTGAGLPKPFGAWWWMSDYGVLVLHLTLPWAGPSLPLDENMYATENEKYIIC